MRRSNHYRLLLLSFFLMLAGAALAQQGNTVAFSGAGAPTGSCAFMFIYTNTSNGDFYNCLNGSWNKVTSVGGGGNVSTTQTNVYGAFLQDFSAATMEIPESAAFVSTVDSTIGIDTNTGIEHLWGPGSADALNVVTSSTSTTATQVLHATATAGLYTPSAIAAGDLPATLTANPQTTTYQVLASDFTSCKTINVASGTFTITLVASGTQPANGQCIWIVNYGAAVVTIARSGQNINGAAANFTLLAGNGQANSALIISDGTNYTAAIVGNAPLLNSSNAGTAAMTLNMIASTGANSFRTSAQAGNTATATGAFNYDTTTGLPHMAVNAVDATVAAEPARVSATAQTAAIGTATLCTALQCPANPGHYKVDWEFTGGGTACSSVTAGSVTFLLTWTDENAVTHSAVALQMMAQTGAATSAMGGTFPFQTALANEGASGTFSFSTNGTIIQYATGYTACTTGTGTYSIRAEVTRLQ